jgi:quinol monooxygenase YgiN
MFARVSHERFPREHHDAGMRNVVDVLLPALRQAPGYRGCYVLADGKPGAILLIALWATEEAADTASAQRDVIAAFVNLAALGLRIESRKIYEVVAWDEIKTGVEAVNQPDDLAGTSGSDEAT